MDATDNDVVLYPRRLVTPHYHFDAWETTRLINDDIGGVNYNILNYATLYAPIIAPDYVGSTRPDSDETCETLYHSAGVKYSTLQDVSTRKFACFRYLRNKTYLLTFIFPNPVV